MRWSTWSAWISVACCVELSTTIAMSCVDFPKPSMAIKMQAFGAVARPSRPASSTRPCLGTKAVSARTTTIGGHCTSAGPSHDTMHKSNRLLDMGYSLARRTWQGENIDAAVRMSPLKARATPAVSTAKGLMRKVSASFTGRLQTNIQPARHVSTRFTTAQPQEGRLFRPPLSPTAQKVPLAETRSYQQPIGVRLSQSHKAACKLLGSLPVGRAATLATRCVSSQPCPSGSFRDDGVGGNCQASIIPSHPQLLGSLVWWRSS
ncbi:hypothetical protein BAUCODRAFT_223307 [Baudoinia panamericana UAMH 10762]|uniref:Secreted protein n=1 Tax=Baudoinia panamericana (strain UAMH 10762) TaxID=717646 RepID=M2MCC4_BAUPA|nr:uncharacterized protein BAUCODRAFT_223307 [Baudoinia panamericana UAMH 10762]EMC94171.1 hypothetical protein BAUCODRAFT_223307 [Baudoinia panamericana UAMH 10762]